MGPSSVEPVVLKRFPILRHESERVGKTWKMGDLAPGRRGASPAQRAHPHPERPFAPNRRVVLGLRSDHPAPLAARPRPRSRNSRTAGTTYATKISTGHLGFETVVTGRCHCPNTGQRGREGNRVEPAAKGRNPLVRRTVGRSAAGSSSERCSGCDSSIRGCRVNRQTPATMFARDRPEPARSDAQKRIPPAGTGGIR
jgi:hypothetical protein